MSPLRKPLRPLLWNDRTSTLCLLDQTSLPTREVYRSCRTVRDVVEAIRTLQVRGAPLIGIAAAYGMALAQRTRVPLRTAARRLITARPTAVNLRWAVERVLRTGRDPLAEARRIHAEDAAFCSAMGRHGARLIPEGARVLTICNTGALATGGIGTAFGVLLTARRRIRRIWQCETRPLLQGARLSMVEYARTGLPAVLIPDSAAATLFARKELDLVITGADRIAANGDTANKLGTRMLAELCHTHRVPFYIAAPSSTFDPSNRSGRDIPIEERDPDEVRRPRGTPFAPPGCRVFNPAFDVTPASLITAFITERGILRPPYRRAFRTTFV
jgi:methylthioribose-1-phosphate isomerase